MQRFKKQKLEKRYKKTRKEIKRELKIDMISISFITLMIGFIIGIFFISFVVERISDPSANLVIENPEDFSHCTNRTFYDTVDCLRNYVKTFYNYVNRDEIKYTGDDGSLQDVIENGGDCYDYSSIYVKLSKELGYEGSIKSFYPSEGGEGHTIAIIYTKDMKQYCTIDQLLVNCISLGGNTDDDLGV